MYGRDIKKAQTESKKGIVMKMARRKNRRNNKIERQREKMNTYLPKRSYRVI